MMLKTHLHPTRCKRPKLALDTGLLTINGRHAALTGGCASCEQCILHVLKLVLLNLQAGIRGLNVSLVNHVLYTLRKSVVSVGAWYLAC